MRQAAPGRPRASAGRRGTLLIAALLVGVTALCALVWWGRGELASGLIERHLVQPLAALGVDLRIDGAHWLRSDRIALIGLSATAREGPLAGQRWSAREMVIDLDWELWLRTRDPLAAVQRVEVLGLEASLPAEALQIAFWQEIIAAYRPPGEPLPSRSTPSPVGPAAADAGRGPSGLQRPLTLVLTQMQLSIEGADPPIRAEVRVTRRAGDRWEVDAALRRDDAVVHATGSLLPQLAIRVEAEGLEVPRDVPPLGRLRATGELDFTGAIRRDGSEPVLKGRASLEEAALAGLPVDGVVGQLRVGGSEVGFEDVRIERGSAVYLLSGGVFWGEESGWQVEIDPQPGRAEDLLHAFGLALPLSGGISGTLAIRRDAPAPIIVQGDLSLTDGTAWGQPFERLVGSVRLADGRVSLDIDDGAATRGAFGATGLRGRADWREGRLQLHELTFSRARAAGADDRPLPRYTVRGSVTGVGTDAALDLAVAIRGEDPGGLLALGGLRVPAGLAGGVVEGEATVSGTLADPYATVDLRWSALPESEGLRFRLVFADHRIRLHPLA